MRIGRTAALAAAVLLVLAMSAYGQGATSKELTVYTALPESEIPTYFNEFEKDTGIRIQYVRLSAGEILARIKAEKSNPQASLWHGGSYDNFIAAMQDGLLERYQSPELANVPKEYVDANGVANPFYVGAIAFACNTEWFKKKGLDYPTAWDDLLKPDFKGQISMAHPGTSGTSYTILATLVQMRGEVKALEYFKALNRNVRQYTKSGTAPPMQAGLGEAAVAITFSHDGLKPAAEGYPVALSFPRDGTGYEIGCLAIIKGGPARELANAKRFIDWSISKRGQELFEINKSFRLPVNRMAAPPKGAIEISDLKVIAYDAIWAGKNRKRLVEAFVKEVASSEGVK